MNEILRSVPRIPQNSESVEAILWILFYQNTLTLTNERDFKVRPRNSQNCVDISRFIIYNCINCSTEGVLWIIFAKKYLRQFMKGNG